MKTTTLTLLASTGVAILSISSAFAMNMDMTSPTNTPHSMMTGSGMTGSGMTGSGMGNMMKSGMMDMNSMKDIHKLMSDKDISSSTRSNLTEKERADLKTLMTKFQDENKAMMKKMHESHIAYLTSLLPYLDGAKKTAVETMLKQMKDMDPTTMMDMMGGNMDMGKMMKKMPAPKDMPANHKNMMDMKMKEHSTAHIDAVLARLANIPADKQNVALDRAITRLSELINQTTDETKKVKLQEIKKALEEKQATLKTSSDSHGH